MFVYHLIPAGGFRENIIYPLNALRSVHPELYDLHIQKYKDRMRVTETRIPQLDCAWGDVVFLTPVSPERLWTAWKDAGISIPYQLQFLKIPADRLDPQQTRVWYGFGNAEEPNGYMPYRPEGIERYDCVPEQAMAYFRKHAERERTFLFEAVPHVMHRGRIVIDFL